MSASISEHPNIIKSSAQVLVKMTFGRPGKKCENFGICNLEMISVQKRVSLNKGPCIACKVFATLRNLTNGQFKLTVFKTSENKSYLNKYFGRNHFLMEESYELPLKIRDKLGVDKRKIPKGTYRILKKPSSYTIILQLE